MERGREDVEHGVPSLLSLGASACFVLILVTSFHLQIFLAKEIKFSCQQNYFPYAFCCGNQPHTSSSGLGVLFWVASSEHSCYTKSTGRAAWAGSDPSSSNAALCLQEWTNRCPKQSRMDPWEAASEHGGSVELLGLRTLDSHLLCKDCCRRDISVN